MVVFPKLRRRAPLSCNLIEYLCETRSWAFGQPIQTNVKILHVFRMMRGVSLQEEWLVLGHKRPQPEGLGYAHRECFVWLATLTVSRASRVCNSHRALRTPSPTLISAFARPPFDLHCGKSIRLRRYIYCGASGRRQLMGFWTLGKMS